MGRVIDCQRTPSTTPASTNAIRPTARSWRGATGGRPDVAGRGVVVDGAMPIPSAPAPLNGGRCRPVIDPHVDLDHGQPRRLRISRSTLLGDWPESHTEMTGSGRSI